MRRIDSLGMIAAALPKRLSGKGLEGRSTILPGSGAPDLVLATATRGQTSSAGVPCLPVDPDRFDHMQLALRKAAETVQIIVLTCRPREWRSLGAPVHFLRDLAAAASA